MSEFASNVQKVEIVNITPDMASAMLASDPTINAPINPNNRKRRTAHIKKLAGAMSRGEWRVSTDAIGFNRGGLLINGQHRLSAIVESKCTVKNIVAYGLGEEAFQVIDTGVKRSVADLMHLDKREAEIISFAMRIKFYNAATVDQMRPYYDAGLGALAHELIERCGGNRNFFSTAPFRLAACILALAGHDKDYVFDQYRALINHDWDNMAEISKAIWKKVDKNIYTSADRYILLALAFKVFDASKAGNTKIGVNDQEVENASVFVRRILDAAKANYETRQ